MGLGSAPRMAGVAGVRHCGRLLVAVVFIFPPVARPLMFQAYTWSVVLLLVLVCWRKGEPPRWRWGK